LWKKNLEISFSAHQIKTQRERERATVSMKESIRNDERKTVVVERASSFGRDDAFFVFLFLL
jgi:hypothetical protein